MRRTFSPLVEAGRVMQGQYGTIHGQTHGAFFLMCPLTKTELKVIVGGSEGWRASDLPEPPWEHVSVSTEKRCPSWKEMCFVKDLFFEPEECVVQFHPPASKYINEHPSVLHLWRVVGVEFPMPPVECV